MNRVNSVIRAGFFSVLVMAAAACGGGDSVDQAIGLDAVDDVLRAEHAERAGLLHGDILKIDSIEELSRGAEVVLTGKVAEVKEIYFGGLAYEVKVDVQNVARGDAPEQVIIVDYPIGEGPIEPQPRVKEGSEYLFYLLGPMGGDSYYRLYGDAGLFSVDGSTATVGQQLSDTSAKAKLHDLYSQLTRFPFEGPLAPGGERLDLAEERARAAKDGR